LLLSGPKSSAGGRCQTVVSLPGWWNRIHLIVEDLPTRSKGSAPPALSFRNDIVKGPGRLAILVDDPSGNPIELFDQRLLADAVDASRD